VNCCCWARAMPCLGVFDTVYSFKPGVSVGDPSITSTLLPHIVLMSSDSWPPQLKCACHDLGILGLTLCTVHLSCRRDWVAKCLGQMTDANRAEAQAELRQVIADAFAAKTLWTTDWAAVQLARFCYSNLPFIFSP
jgi:hypothetical protein